jgi:hypothetical protein
MTTEERIARAEAAIRAAGYTVRYVEWCEDARTPGILGYYRGVTDRERREVKVGVKAHDTRHQLADTLEHEQRHVEDPSWDCGNRSVVFI